MPAFRDYTPAPTTEMPPREGAELFGYGLLGVILLLLFTCGSALLCSPKCDWLRAHLASYRLKRARPVIVANLNIQEQTEADSEKQELLVSSPRVFTTHYGTIAMGVELASQPEAQLPPAAMPTIYEVEDEDNIESPLRRLSASRT